MDDAVRPDEEEDEGLLWGAGLAGRLGLSLRTPENDERRTSLRTPENDLRRPAPIVRSLEELESGQGRLPGGVLGVGERRSGAGADPLLPVRRR